MRHALSLSTLLLLLLTIGCGDGDHGSMMTEPRGMMGSGGNGYAAGYGAALVSVTPAGGAVGVPASISIVLRFGAPMRAGTEQYVDLHVAGIDGPIVPMACGFSSERTTLTCAPAAPLASRTTYLIHVGGAMTTQDGHTIDFDYYGPDMGGQWIMGGMMGRGHAGQGWGMMGPGWRGPNGSYGMVFPFTTA